MTASQPQHQFDVDISSRRELHELQRLEKTHGKKVHDWVDEGMPTQVMGTPSKMDAFRKQKKTSDSLGVQQLGATPAHIQRTPEGSTDLGDEYSSEEAELSPPPETDSRTPAGSYRDHPAVIEGRQHLLRGLGQERTIQAAIKQRGPSCLLAALQAGLAAKGRNTASLRRLLERFPEAIHLNHPSQEMVSKDVLKDDDYSVMNLIDDQTTSPDFQTHLKSVIGNGVVRPTNSYLKGLVTILTQLYDERETGYGKDGRLTPDQRQQVLTDLSTGENLLKMYANKRGHFGEMQPSQLEPNENMDQLKTDFMEMVDKVETPMLLTSKKKYLSPKNLLNSDTNDIDEIDDIDDSEYHVVLLYGIRRDEEDNTFVELRNPNQEDGITYEVPLNTLLSQLNKHPADVDDYDAFLLEDLRMDDESMNAISQPTAEQHPSDGIVTPEQQAAYNTVYADTQRAELGVIDATINYEDAKEVADETDTETLENLTEFTNDLLEARKTFERELQNLRELSGPTVGGRIRQAIETDRIQTAPDQPINQARQAVFDQGDAYEDYVEKLNQTYDTLEKQRNYLSNQFSVVQQPEQRDQIVRTMTVIDQRMATIDALSAQAAQRMDAAEARFYDLITSRKAHWTQMDRQQKVDRQARLGLASTSNGSQQPDSSQAVPQPKRQRTE